MKAANLKSDTHRAVLSLHARLELLLFLVKIIHIIPISFIKKSHFFLEQGTDRNSSAIFL